MKFSSFLYRVVYHLSPIIPDKQYLKFQFKSLLHYDLNLENPKTFNEKLQWLKIYDRKPIYSALVDKYEVKQFVTDQIGPGHVIPTLGIYNSVDEINYDKLPDSFVIKTTHDSGTVIVCKDKSILDKNYVKKFITKRLKRRYYYYEREWPYKNVKPRIIIEELIGKNDDDILDYKFFCFDGKPEMMFIVSNRFKEGGHKGDFYDMDGNHLNVWQPGFENNSIRPELPNCYKKMQEYASILSKGIPQLRVDFYYVNGVIYVGELTFSDGGGYCPFIPDEYNYIMGDYIKLTNK